MLTKEKYIILEDIPTYTKINTELCIINYNIIPVLNETHNIIQSNPNTTFWIATNNFSKEFVQQTSKLGIQNIIPIPIKKELIHDFFKIKQNSYENNNLAQQFEKLEHSKVLIVDDNELNIKLLTEILGDLGIQITTCLHPMSALELISFRYFNACPIRF